MDAEEFFAVIGGLVFLFLLGVTVIGGIGSYQTSQGCLSAGYSNHKYSLIGDDYCVMRVDQTDIVVPFDRRGEK